MSRISDQDIDFIMKDLANRGLNMPVLKDELCDHICCLLEKMDDVDFHSAYKKLIDSFEEDTFRNLQHKTELSTNIKYQKMKKTMFISGITGTFFVVIGAFLNSNNISFGGLCFALGSVLIILGFLPLFFFTGYQELKERKNVILPLVGYITLSLMILGVLFRVQHWPGARVIATIMYLFALIVFLPLYLVSVFKKTAELKSYLGYLFMIILISAAVIYMSDSLRIGKGRAETLKRDFENSRKDIAVFSSANDSIFSELQKRELPADLMDKIQDLRKFSSLIGYQNRNVMLKLIKEVNGDSATIENFKKADDSKAFNKVLANPSLLSEIQKTIGNFRTTSFSIVTDPVERRKIMINMNSNYNLIQALGGYEAQEPSLILGLLIFSNFELHIEMIEYEVLKAVS